MKKLVIAIGFILLTGCATTTRYTFRLPAAKIVKTYEVATVTKVSNVHVPRFKKEVIARFRRLGHSASEIRGALVFDLHLVIKDKKTFVYRRVEFPGYKEKKAPMLFRVNQKVVVGFNSGNKIVFLTRQLENYPALKRWGGRS